VFSWSWPLPIPDQWVPAAEAAPLEAPPRVPGMSPTRGRTLRPQNVDRTAQVASEASVGPSVFTCASWGAEITT
jgi:hypothetical protein